MAGRYSAIMNCRDLYGNEVHPARAIMCLSLIHCLLPTTDCPPAHHSKNQLWDT